MIKKRFLLSVILLYGTVLFGTTLNDCYELKRSFQLDNNLLISNKIKYDKQFEFNKDDYLSKLASCIMAVAYIAKNKMNDNSLAKNTIKDLEFVIDKDDSNCLAIAYCGIAYSLSARDSDSKIAQWMGVKKSIKYLDLGVEKARGNAMEWYVRFLRANCYACLPENFDKWNTADDDYSYIFKYAEKHKEIEPYLVSAFYYKGVLQSSRGDKTGSLALWKKSVNLNKKLKLDISEAIQAEKKISQESAHNEN